GAGGTDEGGRFAVGGLPDGSYTVTASLPGCQPGVATATVTAGKATALNAHITCPPRSRPRAGRGRRANAPLRGPGGGAAEGGPGELGVGGGPEGWEGGPEEAAVARGGQARVEDRDHPLVLHGAQQPARALGQQQACVCCRHGHEAVAAARGHRTLTGGGKW